MKKASILIQAELFELTNAEVIPLLLLPLLLVAASLLEAYNGIRMLIPKLNTYQYIWTI